MAKKKPCWVCGKGYRGNLFEHVWSAHPRKTKEALAKRKKAASKKPGKTKRKKKGKYCSECGRKL